LTAEDNKCGVRLQLEEGVRELLRKLAVLASEEADIVPSGDDPRMDAVDREIENILGEKERAVGALKYHRAEHGC
jgi:hypothetical protein